MKKLIYPFLMAAGLLSLASCGGENQEETTEETPENPCTGKNDVFFQVERYGYQFDSTFVFNGDFKVVRTEWTMTNDSTATLDLYNFENGAANSDNNLRIKVDFHSKNGKKIEPGIYPYMEYSGDYWCMTTINSPKGTVYFNWFAGMPEQGHVELKHADKDGACGKFSLSVDNQSQVTIGHVVLNGGWSTK